MALGENVPTKDRMIKKTEKDSGARGKGRPSLGEKASTYGAERTTMYIKKDVLRRVRNFAYWDRHTITDAFNIALEDGLKGKNTKDHE